MSGVRLGSLSRRPPYEAYQQFTHGGNYWRDLYLLERWDQQIQPVVYRGDVYHGYELLRRVGSWCWLTKDPKTSEFLTVKFLPRGEGNREIEIFRYITKHCQNPFVSTLRDSFTIPHHLSKARVVHCQKFKQISFQALVYPTTGTCMGRCADVMEKHSGNPDVPFTLERRQVYVGQVVEGLCALHRVGVVHGDIHLGNVALAPPSVEHLARLFARPPLEHEIRTITGHPPPPWMPHRSTEPEDIGFTASGGVRLIDFGFSFIARENEVYAVDSFPKGTPPLPELLTGQRRTSQPFKADSWYLGNLMYAILTDGPYFVHRPMGCNDQGLLDEYRLAVEALACGEDEFFNELPKHISSRYLPILLGLLEFDPSIRLFVQKVSSMLGSSHSI